MLTQVVAYLFIYFFTLTSGQIEDSCPSKETCGECIQEIDCEWCIEPKSVNDAEQGSVHCRRKTSTSDWCQKTPISPEKHFSIIEDRDYSDDVVNPTQIKPQRVKLSLRKSEEHTLNLKFRRASNYPVDLYYIMDLSKSMDVHKKKLAELGKQLADTMVKLTTNFNLGFGSFIDKVDLPFVNTVPEKLKSPCETNNKDKCVTPYSFKHHMNLTSDYEKFVDQVRAAPLSGNLDAPEGGFDAIMQAMVCKEKIGWRDQARHLLVLSTDAVFHVAGDGKLAGVIEPNPAKCYKNNSEYLIYDYPSVSQINYVAVENNINIIFAIVKKPGYGISKAYKLLSSKIKNSNFGELNEDGKNVIDLIVENYNNIVQSLTLTHNAPNEVDVKFSSNCNSAISERCNNIHVGQEVEFNVTIQLRECPRDNEKTKTISIRPEAVSESLLIELEYLCDCPCESKTDSTFEPKSKRCNGMGDLKCGVCDCFTGSFGRNCQCNGFQNTAENVTNCIKENTNEICSGLGTCRCGKCECKKNSNNPEEKISGQYCECDNYSCKRVNGLLCSGPERGTCICKQCECKAGFSGSDCQCDERKTNCIAPGSSTICSNHGKCVCGQCECEMIDNNRYSGKYCDECTSCPAARCEELGHCVQCQAYNSGIYKDTCQTNCTAFQTRVLGSLNSDDIKDIKKCKIPDNDTCIINFDYYYEKGDQLIVRALNRKVCPEPPNVLAWILGVIGTILVAGLILLLIWKVFTTIHDRREYEKFENERKKLHWGTNENPLYKEVTSTFANPAYQRNSVFKKK